MRTELSPVNRFAAGILALVWACTGLAGLVVVYLSGRWLVALAAFCALAYAVLWGRIAARERLLACWRAR